MAMGFMIYEDLCSKLTPSSQGYKMFCKKQQWVMNSRERIKINWMKPLTIYYHQSEKENYFYGNPCYFYLIKRILEFYKNQIFPSRENNPLESEI